MQALACSTLPRPHGGGGREPEMKLCVFLIQQTLMNMDKPNLIKAMKTVVGPYLCHKCNICEIVSTQFDV